MDDNGLHLQLLSLQNSLASKDGKSLCAELERMENVKQCVSGCYKKIELLLHNAVQDKTTIMTKENHIKELEIKLAKVEVNVSTYADKIKDKDDVISALKMSIGFCKNNSSNSNESSSELDDLKACLRNRDNQLAKLQSELKQTILQRQECEARSVCFYNQIQQMKVHLCEYESMIKSTPNAHQHLLVESTQQIAVRDRHIEELKNLIKSKDAQIVLYELESNNIKDDSKSQIDDKVSELEEKVKLLATQEAMIKEQTKMVADLQLEIEQKDEKLKEIGKLLALCKAQLKEKDDKHADKLLKDLNARINGYTNTIKQLRQNNSDLQTRIAAIKTENVTYKETIKQLQDNLVQFDSGLDVETIWPKDVKTLCDAGWNIFYRISTVSEMSKSLGNLSSCTTSDRHELLIRLVDFNDSSSYVVYDNFVVGNKMEGYKIKSLGNCSGNAGDGMRHFEGNQFKVDDHIFDLKLLKRIRRFWGLVVEDDDDIDSDDDTDDYHNYKTILWKGAKYKLFYILIRRKNFVW